MNEPDPRSTVAGPRPWHDSPLLRITAVLAVIIGSGVVLSTPHDRFFVPPMASYTAAAGERTTLRLADGSLVVLAPLTEIRVPERFRAQAREVELRGTAYFEIAADPDRPFIVRAGTSVTRVLGTRFAIRAYADENAVEVAVAEGRVEVTRAGSGGGGKVQLLGGEVGRVDASGVARVSGAGVYPHLAWIAGRMVFVDRPLAEIAREIERWYDVEVRIPDPALALRSLTLSFREATLDDVLGVIAASVDARYSVAGSSVTLLRARAAP